MAKPPRHTVPPSNAKEERNTASTQERPPERKNLCAGLGGLLALLSGSLGGELGLATSPADENVMLAPEFL